MKKPGKPKPKRRAQKSPAVAVARTPAASVSVAPKASPGARPTRQEATSRAKAAVRPKADARRAGPAQPAPTSFRLQPVAARTAVAHPSFARASIASALDAYPSDDRSALALLLLPFLILAASLGLNQTWRYTVSALPEIAVVAPISRPVAARPAPVPDVVAVRPLEAAPPALTLPALTLPGTLQYPTQAPPIEVASLDPRPQPPVPVVPVAPAIPIAPPQVDITAWSPPRPAWHDGLATPPEIAIAPLPISPTPPAPIAAAPQTSPADLCQASTTQLAAFSTTGRMTRTRMPLADTSDPAAFGLKLATAARAQTQDLVIYSARYHHMAYPMGDMPSFFGACTDVIIRAYRSAGIDLQEQVQRTHAGRGDTNIDHRRTETLRTLFSRAGASLAITRFPEDYKPGDIVTYHRPFSRVSSSHIAMVSDVLAPSGRPMIVHNRGWGPQLEDALFVDRITGHYRYLGPAASPSVSTTVAEPAASAPPPRGLVKASFPGAGHIARRLGRGGETDSVAAAPAAKAR